MVETCSFRIYIEHIQLTVFPNIFMVRNSSIATFEKREQFKMFLIFIKIIPKFRDIRILEKLKNMLKM